MEQIRQLDMEELQIEEVDEDFDSSSDDDDDALARFSLFPPSFLFMDFFEIFLF